VIEPNFISFPEVLVIVWIRSIGWLVVSLWDPEFSSGYWFSVLRVLPDVIVSVKGNGFFS
jgi:hypothetical protein